MGRSERGGLGLQGPARPRLGHLLQREALRRHAGRDHDAVPFVSRRTALERRGGRGGGVYRGGVSEASFEFDASGRLWAVTRNEDGDASGFGSHVVTAPPERPGAWEFPARSHPERYDSPRLFRHGSTLYLLARRDLGPTTIGSRWARVPQLFRKLFIWQTYWLRPKRTALYRLDTGARRVVPLLDLPSAGDTAFPSVARLGPHEYLVANYTSALTSGDESWLAGQVDDTKIYFVLLRFVPNPGGVAVSSALARPVLGTAPR